jgi:Na+-translocating ferredoxin:NAD+ oxidoreductase subunit E
MDKGKIKNTIIDALKNNPILVMGIGLCPTLAVSNSLKGALFLGVVTLIVLILSSGTISLLRKIIPNNVRVPIYIIIIGTIVTITQMILQKYFLDVYSGVSLYISLIIVNCIVIGRLEVFASKNDFINSILDALFIGIGFTFVICLLGLLREIFGNNTITLFNVSSVFGGGYYAMKILVEPSGGFILLGLMMALFNAITAKIKENKENKKEDEKYSNKMNLKLNKATGNDKSKNADNNKNEKKDFYKKSGVTKDE